MSLIKNVSKGIFSTVRRHKSFSEGDGFHYDKSTPTSVSSSKKSSTTNLASPVVRNTKPSDYTFLILDVDPNLHWEQQEDLRQPIMDRDACKIYKQKSSNLLAHTKIIDKFSDDYFDDYLVEMGILDECSLKFEDRMNEIEILRQCEHQNIIRFYDAYYNESKLWVFTEFCSGGPLDTLIFDLNRPLNIRQIHYVTSKILSALTYLHEKHNYVHHDLRAANILVAHDGETKLGNFSISAKNSEKLSSNKNRYSFIASPHWTPPETALSERQSDAANYAKADSWSLGITCIEMAEKFPPLNQISPERVMTEIRQPTFSPRLKEPDNWPYDFNDFINKCLIRRPEARPNAAELIKHPFVVKTKSTRDEMASLIVERSRLFNEKIKESIEETEKSFDLLKFIKSDTEIFVDDYFQELKKQVDASAEDAIKRIQAKQKEIVDQLSKVQSQCKSNIRPLNEKEESEFQRLQTELNTGKPKWNEVLSKQDVAEEKLLQTNKDILSLKDEVDKQVDQLRSNIFMNKNYSFFPKEVDENAIGELGVSDMNDKSVIQTKVSLYDDYKFREKTKMIRLELVSTAKGRYKGRTFMPVTIPEY